MKKRAFVTLICLTLAMPVFAQMGGGNGNGNGNGRHGGGGGQNGQLGVGNGAGVMAAGDLLLVADDGSVLIANTQRFFDGEKMSGIGGEIVNISSDGTERWAVTFEGTRPMLSATAGNLALVLLVDAIDPEEGVSGWGKGGAGMGPRDSELVAIDVSSGVELWRFAPEDLARLRAQISDDGSMVYVVANSHPETCLEEPGSGECAGQGTATLFAINAFGDVLWSRSLSDN